MQPSPDSAPHASKAGHVVPLKILAGVFASLALLTVVTVTVSKFDFGAYNLVIALAIAVVKASLVVLFFMHVKGASEKMTGAVIVSGFFFLAILLSLSLADYLTRSWR